MKDVRIILVVSSAKDDVEAIRSIWGSESEYEILEAENGTAAKAVLEERKDADVIFLDIIWPDTGGMKFLEWLKEDSAYEHIPVVVNSQPDKNTQMDKALLMGAEDFILKPYNMEILRRRLSNVISRNLHDRDHLTDLYTALTFYNQTRRMLLKNADRQYAMFYFNIKGFTLVNDFYGIEKGDSILLEIAQILRECVGTRGTYGRMIADNFVCCVPIAEKGEEVVFFRQVEERMAKIRNKYHFNLECGIYMLEDLATPVSIMCDRAKFSIIGVDDNFGKQYAYYDMDMAKRYRDEQRIISDMEKGLEEHQFFIMLQPVFDTETEQLTGAEALVRWSHPEIGIITPDIFIPLFETSGFISRLDYYVWEEVCRLLADMREKGQPLYPISINVSRIDLYNPGIVDSIERLLEKYELPKNLVRLEITETAYTEKPREIITLVSRLRSRGFELLMDDFGSGYSSLNMLREMPIDTLKIDMKFMEELAVSRRAGNILISIIRMAKLLNIYTVAEGVETRTQLEFLKNVGCDRIQGYYFSKPLPVEEYKKLVLEKQGEPTPESIYKKGVLVIDDIAMLRKAFIGALGDGYRYFEAGNGKEALEILQTSVSKISIIVTDIFMPEMDGFELIRRLKENSVFSHIPVIVITASEERKNEIKALQLGAVDVITKPYDPVVVSQRVQNVLKLSETEWLQMEMQLMHNEKK